jgi:hypothetical protein
MHNTHRHMINVCLLAFGLLTAACAPGVTVSQSNAQATVTVNPSFQKQMSPIPTVPPYRCGAWSSNNAPNLYATITIYAKLTKASAGVSGASAIAVAHLQDNDILLDQQPVSDDGGYVKFSLSLLGRQPAKIPATVDVSFKVDKRTITCTPAFFTPT